MIVCSICQHFPTLFSNYALPRQSNLLLEGEIQCTVCGGRLHCTPHSQSERLLLSPITTSNFFVVILLCCSVQVRLGASEKEVSYQISSAV